MSNVPLPDIHEYLDRINANGEIPYEHYSVMHDMVSALLIEIEAVRKERDAYKAAYWLAVGDIERCCDTCIYDNPDCEACPENSENWKWRHADKVKEMGI